MRQDDITNDQQQQQIALDPNMSCIVRAAAGSGKTELLIQRFLKLLSVVKQPEHIVAITFTRQAAAEMRQRIINALQQAQNNATPASTHHAQSLQLAQAALKQDQRQQWQLIETPSRLRIQTIDSLCANIVQQAPILAGFANKSRISQQVQALYLLAAENTIMALDKTESWTPALILLLQHLDNELPRLQHLIADMLTRRDQWLRYIGSQQIDRLTFSLALQNIAQSHIDCALTAIQTISGQQPLTQLLRYAASNLQDSDSEIAYCCDLEQLPKTVSKKSLSYWQGLIKLLLTNQDTWRKSMNKNIGFPPGTAQQDKKAQISQLIEQYQAQDKAQNKLRTSLSHIRQLAAIYNGNSANGDWISEQQWKVIQALCQLLFVAEAQRRIVFAERHETDFIDVQQSAIFALNNEQQPTDLALALDYRIHHLLIDEFQDISISQYQLLEQLTESWTEGDGRSLFVVGDPMQSIYRFREAEVSNFLRTYQQQRLGQVVLQPLNLRYNYRSQSSIVDWTNKAFEIILPQQADILTGAVDYSPVIAANSDIAGQVVSHPQIKLPTQSNVEIYQQEAQQISQLVKDLQHDSADTSIAILAANRSHLHHIILDLQQNAIPLQALDMQVLNQRSAIQDCLALTRALLHPADRIAWLAILRAPWAGLTLEDLQQLLALDTSVPVTIWELMQRSNKNPTLSDRGQQQLARINPILGKALTNRRRKSLRRLVEMVWIAIGAPATLTESIDLENVQIYFDLLQNHEQAGDLRDFALFTEALAQCYATVPVQTSQANGVMPVQIMTIHKAKGLEFDIVILPGLNRRSRSDPQRLLLWQEQQLADSSQALLLAPIKARDASDDALYDYIDRLEKQKQQHERGRLLYVATTRAKQQLHLFGATAPKEDGILETPSKGTLLAQLWPIERDKYKTAAATAATTASVQLPANNKPAQYQRHSSAWRCPLPPEDIHWQSIDTLSSTDMEVVEYQWANDPIRHIGTVVHQQLQYLAAQSQLPDISHIKARQPLYEQALKQQGVTHSELKTATQQVLIALTNTINDQRGQWILSKQHQQAQSEYALTGVCAQTAGIISIKIDRTFIDQHGVRWIIDYKVSRHQGTDLDAFLDQQQQRYKQQLEQYAQLMSYQQQHPIKLGFYFPLLKAWQAWTYQAT